MQPFTTHSGPVATMDRSNVDTDQIIPKQFLKRIERTGFGQYLFFDWRFLEDESPNPRFELNRPENQGASILVTRRNFGSGSSREHAVWALEDFGFRSIIAESYSDIFFNNCFKNGVLPIVLAEDLVQQLIDNKAADPDYRLTIDLENQKISDEAGLEISFEIDEVRKRSLLEGLDDIGWTLQFADRIAEYEARQGMQPVG